MKLRTPLFPLIVAIALAASPRADEPCLSDGETRPMGFDRPPLGGNGDPTSAEWTGGSGDPRGYEDDWTSPDDPMGDATPSEDGSSASIEVTNQGGNLEGPNGDDQNGGGEGDCIEVKIRWRFRYRVTRQVCEEFTVGPRGGGGVVGGAQQCWTVEEWRYGYKSSPPREVCPC